MIVRIPASGTAILEDVDNFEAFKIIAAAPDTAFAELGRRDGAHVWVDIAWLKANGRPDDMNWLAGLDKMLAYAEASGWIDESGAVRGHIEVPLAAP
jgi:hypothetical protein